MYFQYNGWVNVNRGSVSLFKEKQTSLCGVPILVYGNVCLVLTNIYLFCRKNEVVSLCGWGEQRLYEWLYLKEGLAYLYGWLMLIVNFFSEEEARMKIYSVSTRHYFAFGALVSEELSYKLKGNAVVTPQPFFFLWSFMMVSKLVVSLITCLFSFMSRAA